jgi:hypothetical protein
MLEGDTTINKIYNWRISYGDVPPDSTVGTGQLFSLTLRSPGDTVRLQLGVEIASNGYTYWRDTLRFLLGPFTVIAEQQSETPEEFRLHQNYPNPFNPTTVISYQVPVVSDMRLAVYDMLGREVKILVDEKKPAGTHTVMFDGTDFSSGVYICRMSVSPAARPAPPNAERGERDLVPTSGRDGIAGTHCESRKMLLIK